MILGSLEREIHLGVVRTLPGAPPTLGGLIKIRPLSCLFKLAVVFFEPYRDTGTGPYPGREAQPHGYMWHLMRECLTPRRRLVYVSWFCRAMGIEALRLVQPEPKA